MTSMELHYFVPLQGDSNDKVCQQILQGAIAKIWATHPEAIICKALLYRDPSLRASKCVDYDAL